MPLLYSVHIGLVTPEKKSWFTPLVVSEAHHLQVFWRQILSLEVANRLFDIWNKAYSISKYTKLKSYDKNNIYMW